MAAAAGLDYHARSQGTSRESTAHGSVRCGAYTRNRGDWLELIPGLEATIRALPTPGAILDGELYGATFDLEGARPASVYEVHAALHGQAERPVSLRYAAFDLLYLGGRDLTGRPLRERRGALRALLTPLAGAPLPVPISLAEGQMAAPKQDVNRLFGHFRAQGYEGIIAKDPEGPYRLSVRDPGWAKRKPELTLDLVLLGATFAVTTKEQAGRFGSYVLGARRPDGGFEDIGDVAGVDRVRDAELQQEIVREGLFTGRRIERPSASGARPGIELRPHVVVTVKLEGIVRESGTGRLSLRDLKIAVIRSEKSPGEADALSDIEAIYLRQRVG